MRDAQILICQAGGHFPKTIEISKLSQFHDPTIPNKMNFGWKTNYSNYLRSGCPLTTCGIFCCSADSFWGFLCEISTGDCCNTSVWTSASAGMPAVNRRTRENRPCRICSDILDSNLCWNKRNLASCWRCSGTICPSCRSWASSTVVVIAEERHFSCVFPRFLYLLRSVYKHMMRLGSYAHARHKISFYSRQT